MENIKKNLPYLLFVGLFLKVSILGSSSLIEFGSLALSLGLLLFYEYQFGNKQIKDLKTELQVFKERLTNYEARVDELRSNMSAVKLNQGLRSNIK